jgi:DNA-binding protein HU-beta
MNPKIRFSDLVEMISEKTGIAKTAVRGLLKEIALVTQEGLLRDGQVTIAGIGSFRLKKQEARPGVNPQSGERIEIPAHNRIVFKPEAPLRRFINRRYQNLKPQLIDTPPVDTAPVETRPPQMDLQPSTSIIPNIAVEAQEVGRPAHQPTLPVEEVEKDGREEKSFPSGWVAAAIILALLLISAVYFMMQRSPEKSPLAENSPASIIVKTEDEPHQPTANGNAGLQTAPDDVSKAEISAAKPPETVLAAQPTFGATGTPGGIHNVQNGDKLWNIATLFYTNAYLWPNIYRVNTTSVANPDFLEIGSKITVPPLEGRPGSLSHSDLGNIADGYLQVYLAYQKMNKDNAYHYLWVAQKYNPNIVSQFADRITEADRTHASQIKGESQVSLDEE